MRENRKVRGPLNALITSLCISSVRRFTRTAYRKSTFPRLDAAIIPRFFLFFPRPGLLRKQKKEEKKKERAIQQIRNDLTTRRRHGRDEEDEHGSNGSISGSTGGISYLALRELDLGQSEGGWGSEEEEYAKDRARGGNRT